MEKVTSQVPFKGINWENIPFCSLRKKTFITNGSGI